MKRHLILLFVGVSLPFLLAAQQKNSVSITKRVLRIPEYLSLAYPSDVEWYAH